MPISPGHRTLIRIASYVIMLAAVMVIAGSLPLKELSEQFGDWVKSLGVFGPVIFAVGYVAATLLMLPGLILTIAAGLIFGLWIGFVIVSIASTSAAAIAFLIARYALRDKVEDGIRNSPRLRAVDAAIGEGGGRIVMLLRLSPAVPFNVLNYLLGITRVSFPTAVVVSWLAMMPGTFLYVYIGFLSGNLGGMEGAQSETSLWKWVLLSAGLIATIVVTVFITRMAKKQLSRRADLETEPPSTELSPASLTKPVVIAGVLATAAALAIVFRDEISSAILS